MVVWELAPQRRGEDTSWGRETISSVEMYLDWTHPRPDPQSRPYSQGLGVWVLRQAHDLERPGVSSCDPSWACSAKLESRIPAPASSWSRRRDAERGGLALSWAQSCLLDLAIDCA